MAWTEAWSLFHVEGGDRTDGIRCELVISSMRYQLWEGLFNTPARFCFNYEYNYENNFHNMPEKDIARLQRVQNCVARVVANAPRFSRSVPILKRLQWLPVKFGIHFKICAITFRTLKENQPAYLTDLLVRPKCSKYLRSTNSNRFVVSRIKTKTGSRAFSISGPALWNALPVPIRNAKTILTFRKLLKSHLFDLAFPP